MQTARTTSRRFAAILLRCIAATLAFTFAGLALADPPMRVARLGYFSGAVSFSPAGETTWVLKIPTAPFWYGVSAILWCAVAVQLIMVVLEVARCLGRFEHSHRAGS